MAHFRKNRPLFFEIQNDLKRINDNPESGKEELMARDFVLYQKTMFRAFLNYEKKDVEKMTIQEFIDSSIMLGEVLKLWHAPYIKKD